ncbi:MAG: hypothetical protein GW875_01085 [Deltaproteobacteria bacterium]|nr:hypothetical protein [Deltaproteobacteria bacterium]NCP02203.1 hypothetical protein [Deltaproteobacteria bacterium]NCP78353.1 hypothetical protein [Desulfuromonadales bacterium]
MNDGKRGVYYSGALNERRTCALTKEFLCDFIDINPVAAAYPPDPAQGGNSEFQI